MTEFQVTKDRRVFLNGIEIPGIYGFDIAVDAGKDPKIVLRVECDKISIDGYTDVFFKQKGSHS